MECVCFSKAGLDGGLSSRVVHRPGPMHDVDDPLTLDAKLVPLYKFMAAYADASVEGEQRYPEPKRRQKSLKANELKLKGARKPKKRRKKEKRKKEESRQKPIL